jgi:hypothetical protein
MISQRISRRHVGELGVVATPPPTPPTGDADAPTPPTADADAPTR